jgi:5-methylcytosine-specific restriction endonuclease McrA
LKRNKKITSIKHRKQHEQAQKLTEWKDGVYKLDGDRCMNIYCGLPGVEAHHIIFRSQDITRKYDLNNGIVLCPECHYKAHNGLGLHGDKTGRQFMIWILEQHILKEEFRWGESLKILKSKEQL